MDRRLTRLGNRFGVWLYRFGNGQLAGNTAKSHVLVLTTPGRRSGLPRSTCMRYLEHEGGYLVWGTGSGARSDPDWFCNLRASGRSRARIGKAELTVTARELLGEHRERVWRQVVLVQVPGVARYAKKAGRTIPVALLTPVQEEAHD
jgi:deazaflavin-dependent oxidoreductase (nitroreductase family)